MKTVLPPVRESYFHSLSGCKKVFWDSALSVPAFGDTFCRFLAILDSMWSPWGTILAPRDAFLGDHFWCRFLDPKKRPKKRVYADFGQLYADIGELYADIGELCAEVRRNVRSRSGGFRGVKHLQNCVGVLISDLTRCDPPTGGQRIVCPQGGCTAGPHFWEICDFDRCTEPTTVTPGCPSHHTLGI